MAHSQHLRVHKDPSRARHSGGEFEFKLAGLVGARLRSARRRNPDQLLRFSIYTNVQGVNPFDDVMVQIQWTEFGAERKFNYFVQLKHAEKSNKTVNNNDLTSKILSKKTKDFNLRKYFTCYQSFMKSAETSKNIEHNECVLKEWAKDECRFIIFTTRDVLPAENVDGQTTFENFPYYDIFNTGRGEIFSFGKKNSRVWDMFEEDPDCQEFRTEFLPRLLIFGGQAHASELDSLIQIALIDAVGEDMPRPELLLSQYISFLRVWWDSEIGDPISEISSELEEIVKFFVNDNRELRSMEFQSIYYSDLRTKLGDHNVTYHIIDGISTRLRCSKFKRLLNEMAPERYMILTESTFRDYPECVLLSVCKNICDEVVINMDDVSLSVQSFISKIVTEATCKVRIMQSSLDPRIYDFVKSLTGQCHVCLDQYWTLEHLTYFEQKRMLEKCVCIQGYNTSLATLDEIWPSLRRGVGGATLDALVCGDVVSLGAPFPSRDTFYLPRTLEHQAVLHKAIFNLQSDKDQFILMGFPDKFLEELRLPSSCWEEWNFEGDTSVISRRSRMSTEETNSMSVKTKWSIFYDTMNNEIQISTKERNLHWLKYECGEILWLRTRECGEMSTIQQYVKNMASLCDVIPLCVHHDELDFVNWKGVFHLSGDPGIGKSTFITHLAHVVKEEHPTNLVVLLRLNEGRVLQNMSPTNLENIVDILYKGIDMNVSKNSFSAKNFLRDCLLESGNINIFIDAVEEVCPSHKEKLLSMLKVILQRMKFQRIWVAGRTVLEDDLLHTMKCVPFKLHPFSAEDQKRYLMAYWGDDEDEMHGEEFKSSVDFLVDDIRKATQYNGRNLCDLPLYSHMLAVAYKHDRSIFMDVRSLQMITSKHKRINLLTLMHKFVDETRKLYWKKVGIPLDNVKNYGWVSKLDAEFQKEHQNCAAFLSLYYREILGDNMETIEKDVDKMATDLEWEKTGIIIKFVDGKPKFVHQMFVDYFSAQWLVEHYVSLPPGGVEELYSGRFEDVRSFLDALLSEGCALHEAVLAGNTMAVEDVLRRHEGDGVDSEDRCGRRALHLAATSACDDVLRALLEHGADVTARDRLLGWTPLRYADAALKVATDCTAAGRTALPHLRVADRLLSAGADASDAHRLVLHEHELLHVALQGDLAHVVRLLVKRRGPLFIQTRRRQTYLHVAAQYGSQAVIEMLLQMGFKANAKEKESRRTALHHAATYGHEGACRALLSGRARVGARCARGRTPLHQAALHTHPSTCKLLIEAGADTNAPDGDGDTPWECHNTNVSTTISLFAGSFKGRSIIQYNSRGGEKIVNN